MAIRKRVRRALVGMALVAPLAIIAAGTVWGGFALAAVPAAWLVSGAMDARAAGRLATVGRALVWGTATSLGAVLLYLAATVLGALVGLVPNTPETPLGYLLILVLTLLSIAPFLALPLACIGIAWMLVYQRVEQRVDGQWIEELPPSGDIPGP